MDFEVFTQSFSISLGPSISFHHTPDALNCRFDARPIPYAADTAIGGVGTCRRVRHPAGSFRDCDCGIKMSKNQPCDYLFREAAPCVEPINVFGWRNGDSKRGEPSHGVRIPIATFSAPQTSNRLCPGPSPSLDPELFLPLRKHYLIQHSRCHAKNSTAECPARRSRNQRSGVKFLAKKQRLADEERRAGNREWTEPFGVGALRRAQGLEQAKRVETAGGGPGKRRETMDANKADDRSGLGLCD